MSESLEEAPKVEFEHNSALMKNPIGVQLEYPTTQKSNRRSCGKLVYAIEPLNY